MEDGPLDDEPLGECRVILVYRSRPELPARRLYGARATGLFIKSPFTAGNVVRGDRVRLSGLLVGELDPFPSGSGIPPAGGG
ncbi:MAG: hypothetical protein C4316_02040 [Chloroflexota bacterium]